MKKKQAKKNNTTWFIPVRGSYLPNNAQGRLTYIPFLGYCLIVPVITFQEASTLAFQIFVVLSNWLLAALVLTIIARNNS